VLKTGAALRRLPADSPPHFLETGVFTQSMRIISLMLALATPALAEQKSTVDVLTRGQQISTAVAASPARRFLLCWASACSVFTIMSAPRRKRARHSLFYSKPHFWIPIGILLVLLFFKDSIGGTVHPLKKASRRD